MAAVCFLGVLMYGMGTALWVVGWVIAGDQEFRSYPHWLDYANLVALTVLVAMDVCLAMVAFGLNGRRAHRSWIAGLVAAGLASLTGITVGLAPLTDPHRSTAGGWGQPWMPEILIGCVILAVGAALLWLLLCPATRRWERARPASGA